MSDFLFYLKIGWEHIVSLEALDHQLFLLVLVAAYNFRDLRRILILITAFTIGHTTTLFLSVLDFIPVSSDWVEFLIPVTIFLTALDNIVFCKKPQRLMKINYFLALIFGLIHGLGFANTVRIMLAEEQSLVFPILGFNVGVELGQVVIASGLGILFLGINYFFKISQSRWLLFLSIGVLLFSLKMILERFPF